MHHQDLPIRQGDLRNGREIAARIAAAGGFLPFDAYMHEVLYAPGLGYYAAGARKLGPGGDFTTAPERSALFGRSIAAQCAPIIKALPGARILEIGPGSGRLAADVLTELAAQAALPERYQLLEVSPELRERQQAQLAMLPPALASRVEFLERPPTAGWCGVLLANEVLDALPCEAFALRAEGFFERGVGLEADGGFAWRERAAPPALAAELARLLDGLRDPPQPDYGSELCTRVGPWIAEVTAALQQGVALFIDYGLPRAADMCSFDMENHPVPTKTNPLGAKGAGEAGNVGALPAIMNAVVDALSTLGIAHIDMPATPHRIWAAIQAAKAKS